MQQPIKIPDGTTKSVVRALDRLERRFGADFPRIFKSITFDNGSEFADCEGLERSSRRKGKRERPLITVTRTQLASGGRTRILTK